MTQTTYAFRQLLIGELTGYAALLGSMFVVGGSGIHPYAFPALVFINALIAFFIVTTTHIGGEWLSQLYRHGGYILVAFEVPALKQPSCSSDRATCWIVANRSEAKMAEKTRFKGDRDTPGSELSVFVIREAVLSIVASIIAAVLVLSGFQTYFAPPISVLNKILALIAVLSVILPLLYLWRKYIRSRLTLEEQTTKWVDYFKDRVKYDSELLATYGIIVQTDTTVSPDATGGTVSHAL
jgi:hypothetical protein